ncbi:acyltransferase, partial [Bacteroides ovatus]|uniref:acyltransferase n=2 Tax=Bacteroides ovatus TaxID=28116 RepID=UPI00202F9065
VMNKISVLTIKNKLIFFFYRVKIASGCVLLGRIQIYNYGKVDIGRSFTLVGSSFYNPLCRNTGSVLRTEKNAILKIGDSVGVSSSVIWSFKKITIGNHVNIGADCIIMDSDAHALKAENRLSGKDVQERIESPIHIGNNVFIGTRCIILKGVSIGDNSVVGAGSVVAKSIPANCIAAGNPCKVIKYFNE